MYSLCLAPERRTMTRFGSDRGAEVHLPGYGRISELLSSRSSFFIFVKRVS